MSKHPKHKDLGDRWEEFSDWVIAIGVIVCASALAAIGGLLLFLWILQRAGG